ncbi:CSEP0138 putative effector protein [Blumeria hordei DH14]|uniref:CSEP0138 putative effector protein n=1 Tax=Blumeria graminis f. sp. hordei (strain DH14) TaxID=546991 RepID=N1JK60_BLUG1|nr:CSEP0138 putative effector protein [Blumeria hordei DH14]
MRFSSIAIILQSASVFVTILAIQTTRHIDEDKKRFDCNVGLLETYGIRTTYSVPQSQRLMRALYPLQNAKLDELLQMPNDQRTVLYSDGLSPIYRFHEMNYFSEHKTSGAKTIDRDHIEVVDQNDRQCAVVLREVTRNLESQGSVEDVVTFVFCNIK